MPSRFVPGPPEQGTGDQVRHAPSPLGPPLPRRSERKPSGIPSVTVEPTVILRSVPAFLPRSAAADTSLLQSRPRKPKASLRRGERQRPPHRLGLAGRLSRLFGFSGALVRLTKPTRQTRPTSSTVGDRLRCHEHRQEPGVRSRSAPSINMETGDSVAAGVPGVNWLDYPQEASDEHP